MDEKSNVAIKLSFGFNAEKTELSISGKFTTWFDGCNSYRLNPLPEHEHLEISALALARSDGKIIYQNLGYKPFGEINERLAKTMFETLNGINTALKEIDREHGPAERFGDWLLRIAHVTNADLVMEVQGSLRKINPDGINTLIRQKLVELDVQIMAE